MRSFCGLTQFSCDKKGLNNLEIDGSGTLKSFEKCLNLTKKNVQSLLAVLSHRVPLTPIAYSMFPSSYVTHLRAHLCFYLIEALQSRLIRCPPRAEPSHAHIYLTP